jgi:type IV pilus assembly protein PilM
MIDFISSSSSVGLELIPAGIKGARLQKRGKKTSLISLFDINQDGTHVNPLYTGRPLVTSSLDGKDVLVRNLYLPITKEKDLAEALPFQAEPMLPFSAEEALLAHQLVSKDQDGSELTLLAVRKTALEEHLERLKPFKIEPEHVGSIQSALCFFGNHFLTESSKTYLIFHIQQQGITSVLIREGKLSASFSSSEQLDPFFQLLRNQQNQVQSPQGLKALLEQAPPSSRNTFNRIKQEIARMAYGLAKEVKPEEIEGILFTGESAAWEGLDQELIKGLPFGLLHCEGEAEYSGREIQTYALPIGLALESFPGQAFKVDFRQQEWAYPHPWKRLAVPIGGYIASIMLLCAALYFFGQSYIRYEESQLKQNYVDLLASMHRSHKQFEISFKDKNPRAHDPYDGEIPQVDDLDREELSSRLAFLQKEIQSSPDSFPLHANTPRVSDVLAWLSHHPAVVEVNEEGQPEAKLQIESFNYLMIKRPQHGKQKDKYQVKVELEFTSPTPKWAREFHDALIEPNEWIDPKGEVKWNTNRGKYRTSFFLRDKTAYPSA